MQGYGDSFKINSSPSSMFQVPSSIISKTLILSSLFHTAHRAQLDYMTCQRAQLKIANLVLKSIITLENTDQKYLLH